MKTKLFSLEIWKFILPLMFLCYISKSNAQCSPDVLILLSQADVDNFGATYPGVTDWDGSIQVGDYYTTSNITNLAGLSNLISICGTLTISYNPLLPNFIGLENLTQLGSISIMSNTLLTNLEGLNNLNSVEDDINIGGNLSMVNLQGLGNLNSVSRLYISNNALINLSGLGNLSITNTLSIYESPAFQSLSGLNLLNTHLEFLSLAYLPALNNIDALQSLIAIDAVQISHNETLNNLNGLSGVESVSYRFAVGSCPNITNVDALQNLTSTGIFTLQELNVSNLNGLVNLQSADEIFLFGCTQLQNLSGLENLISLKRIQLIECSLLNSIDALADVVMMDYNPATDPYPPYLYIFYNPLLSQCSIAPICQKITDPDFIIDIGDNAVGCETIEAVIDGCNLGTAEVSLNSIKIFPNPSNSIVNISGSGISQVKIFDMIGRKVLDVQIENNTFNVETLAAGRYVAQLMGNGGEIVMENLIVK